MRRGLPIDEFRNAQQRVAVGLGSDRITKALIGPVECANAGLFVVAECGLAATLYDIPQVALFLVGRVPDPACAVHSVFTRNKPDFSAS